MIVDVEPMANLRPMDVFSTDFFKFRGSDYLVGVDKFSLMPFYKLTRSTSTKDAIQALTDWFHWSGWPRELRADGGPAFRDTFKDWCHDHGIRYEPSSPYNAPSNGLAEKAVGQVKRTLRRALRTWTLPCKSTET